MSSVALKTICRSALALLALASVAMVAEKVSPFHGGLSHAIPIDVPDFRGLEPTVACRAAFELQGEWR